jgi:hypothetical protein
VTKDFLSPHNISLVEDGGMHWTPSKQKLIVDLDSKQSIAVHQVVSQWMVVNGFRVIKIHRGLQFDQKPYMNTLIDNIVSKRSETKRRLKKKSLSSF